MRNRLLAVIALGLLMVGFHSPAGAALISTFDSGDEGWTVVEFPGPSYTPPASASFAPEFSSANGNPGGTIYTTDRSGDLFLFSAPGSFLGNQGSYFGGRLSFDLRFVDDRLIPGSAYPDVFLSGNGQVLAIDGFVDPSSQSGLWQSYSVALTTTAGWRFDSLSGALATEAEIKAVLSNLTGLYIRGDYFAGLDQIYLDNPTLTEATAVPVPPSVLLLGTAIAAMGGARLRRAG